MAFTDRLVQYPNRFILEDENGVQTGPYTLIRDEGTITDAGTPLNATNLNSEIAGAVASAQAPLNLDGNGNVHIQNFEAGFVNVKTTTAKTTVKVSVSFPEAFTSVPRVVATPVTAVPAKVSVGVSAVTTTGFDIYVYRTNVNTTKVNWMAFI